MLIHVLPCLNWTILDRMEIHTYVPCPEMRWVEDIFGINHTVDLFSVASILAPKGLLHLQSTETK